MYDVRTNPSGELGKLYYGSVLEKQINDIYKYTSGSINGIYDPFTDKLLPDFPDSPFYANVPLGSPCPPLLVLDLERTLVASVYDAKHGWRHVKRPGVDKFLKAVSQYYEVVIFTENDVGVSQDILLAIDPENLCHKLGSTAAEARDGQMLKRLDYMNRDLRKIILVDDSPEASQLFPRNTILIAPFLDVNSKHDHALEELLPLLQAMIHDGSTDFRATLDDLGTHEASEAVAEYRMRVQ